MAFNFERPIKSKLDMNELEYIVSLHQTADDDRESFSDGSIEGA